MGAVAAEVPAGPWANGFVFDGGSTVCSTGALIAPRVFLMAGHSVAILESMGVTQVWVTFDPVFIRGESRLIPETMHPNPGYRWVASDPNDIAVITFDRPVRGIVAAKLPTLEQLDQMAALNGLHDQLFTAVGHGMQERTVGAGPPVWGTSGERRVVNETFSALTSAFLHFSCNPALGKGGTAMFDSGGPNFIGDTDVIAATTTGGDRVSCAMGTACRLDSPAARACLAVFVGYGLSLP